MSDLVCLQTIASLKEHMDANARTDVSKLLVAHRFQFDAAFNATRAAVILGIGR